MKNNKWYNVVILFWNLDDDCVSKESFDTQYPDCADLDDTICNNPDLCGNLKDYGGDFDYYEVVSVIEDENSSL